MRITGGTAAGVRLQIPRKGPEVRPATDRMREAVFSSLGPLIIGSSVLDLFAGTGAYGLEALSRGAKEIVWIESARQTGRILENNRKEVEKSMGNRSQSRLLVRDFRRHGMPSGERFDFIFADPPYSDAEKFIPDILSLSEQHLSSVGKLLLETRGDLPLTNQVWTEVRRFGNKKSGPSLRVLQYR